MEKRAKVRARPLFFARALSTHRKPGTARLRLLLSKRFYNWRYSFRTKPDVVYDQTGFFIDNDGVLVAFPYRNNYNCSDTFAKICQNYCLKCDFWKQPLLILYHTVPAVGPLIFAYRNLSSTSIYVQWNHSIPQELWRGILIGYRVAWSEDHFSSGHPHDSGGYADVGLNASDYTVTSLHEYWLYDISVAGRTSRGPGIYTTVTLMTDDAGKSFTKQLVTKFSEK